MTGRLIRWIITLLVVLTVVLAGWSVWPISVDTSKADPAVTLANKISTGDIKYTEGYTGASGTRLHYVTAGQGDAILFLHGFPSYWFTMFGLMEEFKSEYRVIAVDGLGVGKSEAPGAVEDYKIDTLVKHLDTLIEELELSRVHIVGHDWGAALAAGYAQAYPSKIETVTMMGALPHNIILSRLENDPEHQETFSYVSKFTQANPILLKLLGVQKSIWEDIYLPFVDQGIITEEQGKRFRQDIGKPRRLNRFIHWYRANFPDPAEISEEDYRPARDTRITVPALFIYGDEDPVVTEALVRDLKVSADDMEVLKLEETGHRPHFEEKQAVVDAIRELIAQD